MKKCRKLYNVKIFENMKLLLPICTILFCITANAQIHERWDVKTLTDGFSPVISSATKTTVAKMAKKAKVGVRNNTPRMNFEKKVVRITGTIAKKVHESDGDFHIEVTDGTLGDSTLACESVDPANSAAANSPFVTQFQSVRGVIEGKKVGDKVTLTGVIFQDKKHGKPTKRTGNYLEMHPILVAK